MRRRQTLIIKVLLGWWVFCLAGQCLALPVTKSLEHGAMAMAEMDHDGGHCGSQMTTCDDSTFLPTLLLCFAAALPLMLWLGLPAAARQCFVPAPVVWRQAQGPPVYLLSQRFRE